MSYFVDILKKESPIILATTGALALVMAVVKAAKAPTPEEMQEKIPEDADISAKAKVYTEAYGETAVYTAVAVGCVFGGMVISQKQITDISKSFAALGVSYAALEKKFWKYRERVRDWVGNGDTLDKEICEDIAEEEIKARSEHPVCSGEEELFYLEDHPNHEFTDTRENVKDAYTKFLQKYHYLGYITFNDFLEYLSNDDVPPIEKDIGWSTWQGDMTYGYSYPDIAFDPVEIVESDGKTFEVTFIRFPFPPTSDYFPIMLSSISDFPTCAEAIITICQIPGCVKLSMISR